ncbi:MAG: tRNA (adenosine(37)-N6)-dimethylallyltransferase MiaA [Planctomycetota bacterium]
MLTANRPVIIVTGPTAAGKGGVARALAARLATPVISLDSMKVYRRMDIGTAKPSSAEIHAVPYQLVDLREPWESFSVGDYLREVERLANESTGPLLFAGGTGFYLHALLAGIFQGPAPDPALRAELEAEARGRGPLELHGRLAALDPEAAATIQATDARRTVRALEVIRQTGETFTAVKARRTPFLRPGTFRIVGTTWPRAELYERINRRVVAMFDRGWVAEVAGLLSAHEPPWSLQADQSIGYRLISDALKAGGDPRTRTTEIQSRTRQFARHQLIWMRKMPVEWRLDDAYDDLLREAPRWVEAFAKSGVMPAPDPARLALKTEV